ncbi:MAG: hypothetical protein NZ704_06475 [Geminicoccaceae bacterium]|nr:hypothetical protein [Geminicoccaceae bacterium]
MAASRRPPSASLLVPMRDREPSAPDREERPKPPPGSRRDPDRAHKLAQALRANLRRRKEQARARAARGKGGEPEHR